MFKPVQHNSESKQATSRIEYHTVGGDSTNFYNEEHDLVTIHIANSQQMFEVAKYFFKMGANCIRNRQNGEGESFEQLYYKYNSMSFTQIDEQVNPVSQPEVITIEDDSESEDQDVLLPAIDIEQTISLDPHSPSYNSPSQYTEESLEPSHMPRKRKREDDAQLECVAHQEKRYTEEEISKKFQEIEDYYRELDDQYSKQYTSVDGSIECDDDSDDEEKDMHDISYRSYTSDQWDD